MSAKENRDAPRLSRPIHPFPARMAPEIAQDAVSSLSGNSTVLDPMAGSGSTLRLASEAGHGAIGIDIDPLAVLISRAWTTSPPEALLVRAARELVAKAKHLNAEQIQLPWIDGDSETSKFSEFWFAENQRVDLRKAAYLLATDDRLNLVHLRIALSRTIVTKDRGASLARDVSHSRPHKVRDSNEYDVFSGFLEAAEYIESNLAPERLNGQVKIYEGDARNLSNIAAESIDLVVTSPPYLNAIDYIRGHRLSLIWLGHTLSSLRQIRGVSIGSERMATNRDVWAEALLGSSDHEGLSKLERRQRLILMRFVQDLKSMMSEVYRVLGPMGKLVIVVGSVTLSGVRIQIPNIVRHLLDQCGFSEIESRERSLPERSRYLPPPSSVEGTDLSKRIRSEVVFKAHK